MVNLERLITLTPSIARSRSPFMRSQSNVLGRFLTALPPSNAIPRNPIKPSSFPDISKWQRSFAESLLKNEHKLDSSAFWRAYAGKCPEIGENASTKNTFSKISLTGRTIEENNQIVASFEAGSIPVSALPLWGMSHLYSGYSHPPMVLKTIQMAPPSPRTHLVAGVAFGIMAQTAKDQIKAIKNYEMPSGQNDYFLRCFRERESILMESRTSSGELPIIENSFLLSLSELRQAYTLDPQDPNIVFFLASQLLEKGDIQESVKLASRYLSESPMPEFKEMLFDELRTLFFASAITGKPFNFEEAGSALTSSLKNKQQIDDFIEALSFVHNNTHSTYVKELLAFVKIKLGDSF